MKSEVVRKRFFSLFLYCMFILLMIITIGNKKNLHVDEIATYAFSNHDGLRMDFEEGYTYIPASEVWNNFVMVDNDARFQYGKVWRNQSLDVHPPFYYMIVHTICSFFPGKFSIWFAGIINILFAVGILFFLRKLVLLLNDDEKLQRLITIAFIGSGGILSAVAWLRMYIVAMFWITVLTYLLLSQIRGGGGGKILYTTFCVYGMRSIDTLLFCFVCNCY